MFLGKRKGFILTQASGAPGDARKRENLERRAQGWLQGRRIIENSQGWNHSVEVKMAVPHTPGLPGICI